MDSYLWSALLTALGQLSGLAFLVAGLLGYFFREKIKQLFSLDIERVKAELQAENGRLLAQQHRDLEAYKVSLIASSEHTKAKQDVQKQLALRLAERRFETLTALFDAAVGLDAETVALATLPTHHALPSRLEEHRSRLVEKIGNLVRARARAVPYLSEELNADVIRLIFGLNVLIEARSAGAPLSEADPRLMPTLQNGLKVESKLRDMMLVYEAMARPVVQPEKSE